MANRIKETERVLLAALLYIEIADALAGLNISAVKA
jgi:hypothetical protein